MCVAMMCEEDDGTLIYTYVTNKSDEIIYVGEIYNADSMQIESVFRQAFNEIYPDSTLPIETYVRFKDSPDNFESVQFFIFKKSTFDEHTYREIIENKLVDKWRIYSYDELKAMDFKLEYHGD